ncbi:VWA domain-containing protein [Urechidicola croceus]|uniref:VWA domain-containing protein n=1 Tax=Urechidicola croceus TaxID=1850246 RepID=UPI0018D4A142|nr:VWA domain-containing protein [Urechidicola croceus]
MLLLLINPKIEQEEIETIKPKLVVAVDNSSSIKYFDEQTKVIDFVEDLKLNKEINNKFDIDYFSFSGDIEPLDSLKFNKLQTNISKPFKQFAELYKNTIAPVILISDGNQTLGADYEYLNYKQPVFPVVVGDTTYHSDLRITQLNVNRYTYLNNKFPVELFFNYDGENSISSNFSIYKGNLKVFSKNLSFSKTQSSQNISFHLPANETGIHYYTAKIEPIINEKNTINNSKNFVVEVIDEQAKILILTSFLHPDIGSLKESIESNKQRKVVIKRIGSELNLEEYQLVILYQPTKAFNAIFKELEIQKLNSFIITGSKTDWNFLNLVQSNFSRNVINQKENYNPVFNNAFSTFVTEDIGFNEFSPVLDAFGEVNFKIPYESLLFQKIGNYSTEKPLLATYENNDRRGAVLFGENSWRWRMTSKLESQSYIDYDNFISKIVQYLSSNNQTKRLYIDYNAFYFSNDEIKIIANYMDKNYMFDSNASLWLTLKNRGTNAVKRYPFSLNGNSYAVVLSGLKNDDYDFSVTVENQNVLEKGSFKILEYDVEQQFTNANVSKLSKISQKSDGSIYFINDSKSVIENFISDQRFKSIQKTQTKYNSLIDWKWLLGLIVVSLSIEWFIRKYKGLI